MRVMMAGSLQQRYVAELMYSVMNHFAAYNDGWAQITFTGNLSASDFDRWLPHRSTRASWDKELMPDLRTKQPWLRDFVIKAFDRDAALAERLEATFNVSPLFEPMFAARRPEAAAPTAEETLTYLFPDVSDLPWEVVMEFREHDAAGEARARLQDAVERAQRDGITAANNQLTRDMIFADKDLRKRHSLKERLTKMAVSVVPVAGGALTEGAGAAADAARGKHDWIAALRLLICGASATATGTPRCGRSSRRVPPPFPRLPPVRAVPSACWASSSCWPSCTRTGTRSSRSFWRSRWE
jgi:hypothetical protein